MARITVEDCLEKTGSGNRFALIHLAVERIKQHRDGQPFLTQGKNKEIVMSLREIAGGEVTFDNIIELGAEPEAPVKIADDAAESTETAEA